MRSEKDISFRHVNGTSIFDARFFNLVGFVAAEESQTDSALLLGSRIKRFPQVPGPSTQ
jgi:hypothetical protein